MKRLFLITLSLLFFAVFAFAGGSSETQGTTSAEATIEGPQYGGTITCFQGTQSNFASDPPGPDIMGGNNTQNFWLQAIQERPYMLDFEKYGPRGTGEYDCWLRSYVPSIYMTGCLLESWELSPEKVIWHFRKGIMWHDNPHLGFDFESRELTADDVVADLKRFREAPAGKTSFGVWCSGEDAIYATDRYTVVIEFSTFTIVWQYVIGYEDRALITPPEMIEAGPDEWINQVGTGPWMIKDYQVGTVMQFVKNPDYWDTTPIDGEEYEYPFIDEMVWPIIPDESTQIAALQTGKIDYYWMPTSTYWDSIDQLAPEIISNKFVSETAQTWHYQLKDTTATPALADKNVRRALMIGTDLKAFTYLEGVDIDLPVHGWPLYWGDPSVHTPLEELPPSTRELFTYDPAKAKKIIADAGYPNGFSMTMNTLSNSRDLDRSELLKSQWEKIGVTLNIKVLDANTYTTVKYGVSYDGMITNTHECSNPVSTLDAYGSKHWNNFSGQTDLTFDAMMNKLKSEMNDDARNALCKEAGVYLIDQCYVLSTNFAPNAVYWWPWIKNYYGEVNCQDWGNWQRIIATAWIDQDLKKKMGY